MSDLSKGKLADKGELAEGLARALAALSALGCLSLWVVFLWQNPYRPAYGPASRLVASFMIAVWIVGLAALYRKRFRWVVAVFIVSFFPVGLYLLGTPGVFLWIGVLTLVYLGAAGLAQRARKARRIDEEGS